MAGVGERVDVVSEALAAENVCTGHVASLPWGEQTPPSGRPASKTAIVHGQVRKIAESCPQTRGKAKHDFPKSALLTFSAEYFFVRRGTSCALWDV